MKSPAKTATTARTVRFTIELTKDQARRLRFVAEEHGQTPESMIARGVIDTVGCCLTDGFQSLEEREMQNEIATKLNARHRAA